MTDKPKHTPLLEPAPEREDLNQKFADAAKAREAHQRLGRGLRNLVADQADIERRDRIANVVYGETRKIPRAVVERELRSIEYQLDHLIENTTDVELSGEELEGIADQIRRRAWVRQRKGA